MYRDIHLGSSLICDECLKRRKASSGETYPPASIWHVGEEYEHDKYKIVFVGKAARGTPGKTTTDHFIDTRQEADRYFFENWSAYWSYTRTITERLYGDAKEGWKRIAFTN